MVGSSKTSVLLLAQHYYILIDLLREAALDEERCITGCWHVAERRCATKPVVKSPLAMTKHTALGIAPPPE